MMCFSSTSAAHFSKGVRTVSRSSNRTESETGLFGPTEPNHTATAKARSAVVPLCELKEGQSADCFVLLVEKEHRQTRSGKPFFTLTVRDRGRRVGIPIWSDSEFFAACEHEWQPGQFFKVRGTFRNTEWGPQLELERVRWTTEDDSRDGFNPLDFRERTRFDVDAMFSEISEIARQHISEISLSQLVLAILELNADGIKEIPAATHNHHAFVGGYLEHVLSVTRTAVYLADKYIEYYPDVKPPISKSLVVAGAILHDIGKLRELDATAPQTVYSVEGRLLGHMLLGRDIVREVAPSIEGLSPQSLVHLEHIIAAHQALREWGAVVEPHTIECLLVHYADDTDAKVNMMVQAIQRDTGPGPFTSRENPLRRHLFKGTTEPKDS
jgi:3'-5' exoribonuclease